MKAERTTRNGQEVLQITLTPEASEYFHLLTHWEQHKRFEQAGLSLARDIIWTCDSDGNVYYFQEII